MPELLTGPGLLENPTGMSGSGETAIRVRCVSKAYQIYAAPRERLKQFLLPRIQAAVGARPRRYYKEFMALTNVSFDVGKGETIGIIGRNGAGKSTLLQIICGTLSPTSGSVEFGGRVAALLELGSGFNAEFTGRENIRLNAGVLGLSAAEIDDCFDAIVAFADIGDFIDQPVKTYSSGMYVRLAFAVIVHVKADILIVDEALSVGDMYFQAKCIAHMKTLIGRGVTVLFVSHDVGAVKALCTRAIYLEAGTVAAIGPTADVLDIYFSAAVMAAQSTIAPRGPQDTRGAEIEEADIDGQREFAARAAFQRIQNGKAEFIDVRLLDDQGRRTQNMEFGQRVTLRMLFRSVTALPLIGVGYHIRDKNGIDVIYSDTGIEKCHIENLAVGEIVVVDWEFTLNLRHGDYSVTTVLSIPQDLTIGKVEICDFIPIAGNFKVSRGNQLPIYASAYWPNRVTQSRSRLSGPR